MSQPTTTEIEGRGGIEFHAITTAEHLTEYINTLQAVDNEATFYFREDGIYTQPIDPANVAVINQTLNPPAFETYETSGFRIGFDLDQFEDFLKAADIGDDLVELELDPETRKVDIRLPDGVEFTMAGIDPDTVRDGQDIEEMGGSDPDRFTTSVVMDAAALKHAIGVVDKVTDHMDVEANPAWENPLHFSGSGDIHDARVRFGNSLKKGSKVEKPSESKFSLEYLKSLHKAIPKQVPVRVEFGEGWPTIWRYSSLDGHREVKMLLSPRVERK